MLYVPKRKILKANNSREKEKLAKLSSKIDHATKEGTLTIRCSQCAQSRKTTTVIPQNLKQNRAQRARQMYLWWSLYTLYVLACQVRVTVGDSGLCCNVCVTSLERLFTPLCVDSLGKSVALDEKTDMKRNRTEARLLNDQPNSALPVCHSVSHRRLRCSEQH